MKYQRDPVWFHGHFENDSVFRTNRAHRCRTVSQDRSTWAVSPASLPAAACRSAGATARYAARTSVATTAPSRYPSGSASHRHSAVRSDRSPHTIATTCRVRASSATHTHHSSRSVPT